MILLLLYANPIEVLVEVLFLAQQQPKGTQLYHDHYGFNQFVICLTSEKWGHIDRKQNGFFILFQILCVYQIPPVNNM